MIKFMENQTAPQLISEYANEPALHDFYQFLGGTGPYNLSEIQGKLWNEFYNQFKDMSVSASKSSLHMNQDLGQMIVQMYDK